MELLNHLRNGHKDLLNGLVAEGQEEGRGREGCGCVHRCVVMVTIRVCASLGCSVGIH